MRKSDSKSPCLTDPIKASEESSQTTRNEVTILEEITKDTMNNEKSAGGSGRNSPCLTNSNKVPKENSQNNDPQYLSDTINKRNQTPHKLDPESHNFSPTYIIGKDIGTPITISETDLRINKKVNCGNNEENNKTIAATLPQYKLNIESIVHMLKAQLDLLSKV